MINKIKQIISSLLVDTNYIAPASTSLKGKVILITGAGGGMGKAIVKTLEKEEATLILVSRNIKKKLEKISTNERIFKINADTRNELEVKKLVNSILKRYHRIDALINTVGIFNQKSLVLTKIKEYDNVIDTNLRSAVVLAKAVIPQMKEQKSGLIVNIGSKISHNTALEPEKVLYATSKFALEGFSYALAKEFNQFGIRVTCLMPATVNTFVSFKSKQYLSPFDVATIILMLLKSPKVQFDSIIFRSIKQDV